MKVVKLNKDATLPTQGSPGAAGYDITSVENVKVCKGSRKLVSTGLAIQLPEGVYGRIAPRSGLTVKHGIHVGAGVIDPDYTGEIKVALFNFGEKDFEIECGDRIAQLILEKFELSEIQEVERIDDTSRGSDGFGSTGTK